MQFVFGSASITSMTTNTGAVGGGSFAFSMDANGTMTPTDGRLLLRGHVGGQVHDRGHGYLRGNPEFWVLMKTTTGT